jgi:hypothetical protein
VLVETAFRLHSTGTSFRIKDPQDEWPELVVDVEEFGNGFKRFEQLSPSRTHELVGNGATIPTFRLVWYSMPLMSQGRRSCEALAPFRINKVRVVVSRLDRSQPEFWI